MLWLWISLILGRYERKERPSNRNAFLGSPENTFALKSHSPAQRRTMPTSHPNTLDFSNIALQHDAGDAFAALPVHVLITHVLSSGNLPDPSDLARLRAVSREMRDAVAATGRRLYQLVAWKVIQFGDLSGLQFLHQRGDLDDILNSLCRLAAGGDNSKYLSGCARMTSRGASRRANVRRRVDTSRCCSGRTRTAARGTRTSARARHTAVTSEYCNGCARNGCPWDKWTCANAASEGHLEMLQWARANGARWDVSTCNYAAEGGHLDVLQWARANGCPWNEDTCAGAAICGQLEVIQWLRANGCPWDKQTLFWARHRGHLALANWAIANGCPK